MQIERQRKSKDWDTLAETDTMQRVMSGWGGYVFEFAGIDGKTYRLTLDAVDLERLRRLEKR